MTAKMINAAGIGNENNGSMARRESEAEMAAKEENE